MEEVLLMMRQEDESDLMEYNGEETQIKKGQVFYFGGIHWVILNLTDDKIENGIEKF